MRNTFSKTQPTQNLVDEWKSSDKLVHTVESRLDQVLTVMTEKFKHSNHSKTSVLQFLKLTLCKFFFIKIKLSSREISEESPVVNSSYKEEDLCPSKGRDCFKSSKSVWNICELDSWGDFSWESVPC